MNASVDLYCEFFNTRLLCRETGRFTRRARNRRSNARRFCSSSLPFLVYFVPFSQVSFSFFQKYKVVPITFYTCFAPQLMDIKLLLSGFKITEPQTKKASFSNTIYISKIVIYIYCFSCYYLQIFFFPYFSICIFSSSFSHPHPLSPSAIRRYPVFVLQTPVLNWVH